MLDRNAARPDADDADPVLIGALGGRERKQRAGIAYRCPADRLRPVEMAKRRIGDAEIERFGTQRRGGRDVARREGRERDREVSGELVDTHRKPAILR